MYACVALLADEATHRAVRRLADALYADAPEAAAADVAAGLPAHVSLKQPFACDNLPAVLDWFDGLAARTAGLAIAFGALGYGEHGESGIASLSVVETPALRALHNQINAELAGVVADPRAPFDGDAYRFHLTVAMGPLGTGQLRRTYKALADADLPPAFVAERLALFVAEDNRPGAYHVARTAPLTGAGQHQQG